MKTPNPRLSVVLPALIRESHHLEMTIKCLESAKKHTKLPFELVIVETGTQYLKEFADIYIYEKHKTNSTISINRGFRCASGDLVTLLTNDVVVDENWLEHLLECFEISDCGLATLASTQFGHQKVNLIKEGVWFSVAMIPKEEAWFDENFLGGSWDDTDIIMRTYSANKKMYRNFKSVVDHVPGQTHYANPTHNQTFEANERYFKLKWRSRTQIPIYQALTMGLII